MSHGKQAIEVRSVMSLREKLQKMSSLKPCEAQRKQKQWYDQNSRQKEFLEEEQVLLLLPISKDKLLAHWQGSYVVLV